MPEQTKPSFGKLQNILAFELGLVDEFVFMTLNVDDSINEIAKDYGVDRTELKKFYEELDIQWKKNFHKHHDLVKQKL